MTRCSDTSNDPPTAATKAAKKVIITMSVAPQPKSNELIDRLNVLASVPRVLNPMAMDGRSLEWRRIRDSLEPLFKVDAREAWAVHGALYSVAGDREEMERGFTNSVKLGWEWHIVHNWLNNRVRLGLLSSAQTLFVQYGDPVEGHFSEMARFGLQSGCIQQAAKFSEQAKTMSIQVNELHDSELLVASKMLAGIGISDADVGMRLDIAGNICLKHGYHTRVHVHITNASDFFSGVTFALAIPVTAQEAFDLNVELAEAEEAAGIQKHIECEVVFKAAA